MFRTLQGKPRGADVDLIVRHFLPAAPDHDMRISVLTLDRKWLGLATHVAAEATSCVLSLRILPREGNTQETKSNLGFQSQMDHNCENPILQSQTSKLVIQILSYCRNRWVQLLLLLAGFLS